MALQFPDSILQTNKAQQQLVVNSFSWFIPLIDYNAIPFGLLNDILKWHLLFRHFINEGNIYLVNAGEMFDLFCGDTRLICFDVSKSSVVYVNEGSSSDYWTF